MRNLGLNEIREKYLSYFEQKGHLRIDSYSLVPQNDKSLLLINAGMAPLKPFFTGEQLPPAPRVTSCQKCIRTPDIENVGKTSRHGTYFEMLGNFSFGDYFKVDAIAYAWEFVTEVLQIPKDKLWVSIYLDDDEAYDIWTSTTDIEPGRIVRLGKEDNFWEHGQGPCGPCSEIHFDRGEKYGCGKPGCAVGCDCDRYVEFWNLVFTQFNSDGKGVYTPLEKKNIDTGMGLERMATIMQGVESIFEVDTIKKILANVAKIADKKYGKDYKTDVSLRVVTDHIRSTTMMICDGVIPSNEGRGYVLRRLLRRAVRHGKLLGIDRPFLCELCDTVIEENKEPYPELLSKVDYIKKVIQVEEERFIQTLESGLLKLEEIKQSMEKSGTAEMSGEDAFKLYDTYGFPVDLTMEILEETGKGVDLQGFDKAMKEQRVRAKTARLGADTDAWKGDDVSLLDIARTEFVGYEQSSVRAKLLAIIKDGQLVNKVTAGERAVAVFERTPFYAESGGQGADVGKITGDNAVLHVSNVKKTPDNKYLHTFSILMGTAEVGDEFMLKIDEKNRDEITAAHSSAHILHSALRNILGKHIQQAGSNIEANKLRFDFTHFSPVTAPELEKIEDAVNEQILKGLDVTVSTMSIAKAKELGATALFGEKYGLMVRVVAMGDYSTELCGGTHIENTARIGMFKITSESSVAAGVRRIEAVTGSGVMEYIRERNQILNEAAQVMKTTPQDIAKRSTHLIAEIKEYQHKIEQLDMRLSRLMAVDLLNFTNTSGDIRVIAVRIDDVSPEMLRTLSDTVKNQAPNMVCVLATIKDEKIQFSAACGTEAIKKGAHAGNILKEVAKLCGGGGGGRPESASAGGTDISALESALEAVNNIVEDMTKK